MRRIKMAEKMTGKTAAMAKRARWERWTPIPGFSGYQISLQGTVRSYWVRGSILLKTPHILTARKTTDGYLYVSIHCGKRRYTMGIHQLMMLAFVGPVPPGEEVSHLDEDSTNNNLSNFTYETPAENHARPKYLKKRARTVRKSKLIRQYRKQMDDFFNLRQKFAKDFSAERNCIEHEQRENS